jgi:predicted ATP-dependent protease
LELQQGSSGAAVLLAVVAAASEEESRHGWAITGAVTLGGEIEAVLGVREKVGGAGMATGPC